MASAITADRHRMTADEYFVAAVAAGWERTELIEGVVYDRSPNPLLHARVVMALAQSLSGLRADLGVVAGPSVRLDEMTVVEPDVVVYSTADADDDAPLDADSVRIVVEVSVSTVARDMEVKRSLYANAGIPDYCAVIPKNGMILRHADPAAGRYQTVREDPFDVGDPAVLIRSLLTD